MKYCLAIILLCCFVGCEPPNPPKPILTHSYEYNLGDEIILIYDNIPGKIKDRENGYYRIRYVSRDGVIYDGYFNENEILRSK